MKSFLIRLAVIMFVAMLFDEVLADSKYPAVSPETASQQSINVLVKSCYQNWEKQDWTLGRNKSLAKENVAFKQGIHRICQARAELFLEGYELSPFIAPDSQVEVFPVVLGASIAQIKNHLKAFLPALKLI